MAERMDQTIEDYVARRLRWLQTQTERPQKAALANLRRGLGRAPGELPQLWGIFLQDLPVALESRDGIPTKAEWAIYLALTLYAYHQQGHAISSANMHQRGAHFGCAVRRLVKEGELPEDSSILRRFNALATAKDMPERAQHLRGIVSLLRTKGIPLDYVQMAVELYWLQIADTASRVCLLWGQDYYRPLSKIAQPTTIEKEN